MTIWTWWFANWRHHSLHLSVWTPSLVPYVHCSCWCRCPFLPDMLLAVISCPFQKCLIAAYKRLADSSRCHQRLLVISFLFCVSLHAGGKDAFPYTYHAGHAPPEVLSIGVSRQEGPVERQECMVNGSAVDVYCLGVLLYRLMTTNLPFYTQNDAKLTRPASIRRRKAARKWETEKRMLITHKSWVCAVH